MNDKFFNIQNARNHHNLPENKRKRAKESADIYAQLSLDDKIALVKSRPGNSARELARLEAKRMERKG